MCKKMVKFLLYRKAIDESKTFKISSRMEGEQEETFFIRIKKQDKINQLERKFLFLPDEQL